MTLLTMTRRAALLAAATFLTAACSQAGGEPVSDASTDAIEARFVEKGVEYGATDAPVTLVEYASLTCGHCKDFNEQVLPTIKENYIKTGKVKLVFREFPTPPVQIALAGSVIARCAGETRHMAVMDDFFTNQTEIFEAARAGQAEDALIALAGRHGINEKGYHSCMGDLDIRRGIAGSLDAAEIDGVNSTPTLYLNGTKLMTVESRTPDGLSALIDAELVKLSGDETPAEIVTEETDAPEGEQ